MAWSTMALVAFLREAILVRSPQRIDPTVAEERARNIMAQLPEILAQTRCACGAQGTVDGDRCAACYLEGRR